jgi:hypothetical protein
VQSTNFQTKVILSRTLHYCIASSWKDVHFFTYWLYCADSD